MDSVTFVYECLEILRNECPILFDYFSDPVVAYPAESSPQRKDETVIIIQPTGSHPSFMLGGDTDWEVVDEPVFKQA